MVNATVYPLDRGRIRIDSNLVLEENVIGTRNNPNPDIEMREDVVWNLLIEHPEGNILIDTGSHPDAANGHWPEHSYNKVLHYDADERTLDKALDEKGFSVDDIDMVVETHLHLDHAGGLYNFEGTDIPIYVHEKQLREAYYAAKFGESYAFLVQDFDLDLNWQQIHIDEKLLCDGIKLHSFSGHTPGLLVTSIELEEEGTLLFTGDQIARRENYGGHPPGAGLLNQRDQWFESLYAIREIARRENATVLFGHDLDQFKNFPDKWT